MEWLEPIKDMQWSLFEKIVNGFKALNIFVKKLHRRCLIGSSYVTEFSLAETKFQKCQLYCRGLFIVNERQPWTKGFYKNEIPIKECIISPSFIFTKNKLLHRFFKVPCPSCRTPISENISRRLLLKQTGENYETYLTHLQPMFRLNPLLPTEKIRKWKIFRHFLGA